MNISSIYDFSNNSVGVSLENALLGAGVSVNDSSATTTGGTTRSTTGYSSDSSQLSPFAQLLSILQQLQQSNAAQYQQVTKAIAANLQTAAQTATSNGNTAQAKQLTQLSADFTAASASGQLPNIQDLAKAISGGHTRHHHGGNSADSSSSSDADGDTDNSSSPDSSMATSSNQALEQILSAFQTLSNDISASQNSSTDPISVIAKTLSDAGIKFS